MIFRIFIVSSALVLMFFLNYQALAHGNEAHENLAPQGTLSPLEILIIDIRDAKDLIQQGENESAITILKSATKQVRKVKEFNKKTTKVTLKRIKAGIKLLKQDRNNEALALLQTGIDELIEAGLAEASDFE